jgi:polyferredoxin
MSVAQPHPDHTNTHQKIALAMVALGLLFMLIAVVTGLVWMPVYSLCMSISLISGGSIWYIVAADRGVTGGIRNRGAMFQSLHNRGVLGWMLGVFITGFYVCLYWFPALLRGLVDLFEPLSRVLRGNSADQWFVYGSIYTLLVLLLGINFIIKYRHQRYQVIRTLSVMFFQLVFSFLLPSWMQLMHQPEFYFTYFWPLKYEYLFPDTVFWLSSTGHLGVFLVFWGVVMSFIAVPVFTYFWGKRWYCSWVCGCGALAETAGDSFRTLSDKTLRAWQIERWLIHGVLVFVTLTTLLLWINSWKQGTVLGAYSLAFSKTYAFVIGAMFSGIVGTGFYPILGNRVWCRFGCPQAALLGIIQKYFSRFRITTNGGQCISCGNCSTHCEMGIDVKAYAQRGQDIVRSSCVGCGICVAVCPRGVLRLENGVSSDVQGRGHAVRTIHVPVEAVKIL